jgi:hypothetical protein
MAAGLGKMVTVELDGVGVGVTGGDGMKFVLSLPPLPHAVSANNPALASRRLEKSRTLMVLLPAIRSIHA